MTKNTRYELANARFKKSEQTPKPGQQAYSDLVRKTERLRAQRLAKEAGEQDSDESKPVESAKVPPAR